tara:strand:- start:503 stop:748 length:246 start_codon:yes stop_codon:yes gene_type:complete
MVFFIVLILTIIGLSLWDTFSPDIKRKGFLPITTSRGDRVFIAIISTIGICLVWLGVAGNSLFLGAVILSIIWNIVIARWG